MHLIGDIRHTINQLPNTVQAAKAAVSAGFTDIALSAVYAPAFGSHKDNLFCCPPLAPEYEKLSTDDYSEWFREFINERKFPRPSMIGEVTAEASPAKVWVFLSCTAEQRAAAIASLKSRVSMPCIAVFDRMSAPTKDGCADPSGEAEFWLCPTNLSSLKGRLTGQRKRLLTYGRESLGEFRLIPAP